MDTAEIKEMVRARYGGIAAGTISDCCALSLLCASRIGLLRHIV